MSENFRLVLIKLFKLWPFSGYFWDNPRNYLQGSHSFPKKKVQGPKYLFKAHKFLYFYVKFWRPPKFLITFDKQFISDLSKSVLKKKKHSTRR